MRNFIVVLGDSNTGKTTVAQYLVDKHGYSHITPLDSYRSFLESYVFYVEHGTLKTYEGKRELVKEQDYLDFLNCFPWYLKNLYGTDSLWSCPEGNKGTLGSFHQRMSEVMQQCIGKTRHELLVAQYAVKAEHSTSFTVRPFAQALESALPGKVVIEGIRDLYEAQVIVDYAKLVPPCTLSLHRAEGVKKASDRLLQNIKHLLYNSCGDMFFLQNTGTKESLYSYLDACVASTAKIT